MLTRLSIADARDQQTCLREGGMTLSAPHAVNQDFTRCDFGVHAIKAG